MRVRSVTVTAINNLSICWETMSERDNGAGRGTKNIDLAFGHFIWSETRRTTRKGFFGRGGLASLKEAKARSVWPPPIQMSPACCKLKATVPPLHIVAGKCGMAGVDYVCVNQMRGKRARRWE